jgi:hypothetical protein
MNRWSLTLVALLFIAARAHGSIHQFQHNFDYSPNAITVVGSGQFELADIPVIGFQYPAITPFTITVDALDGTRSFDLLRASTLTDKIHMIFQSNDGFKLFMMFDVDGILAGDPPPVSWSDDDGVVDWNTNNQLYDPTGLLPLRGSTNAVVTGAVPVPEPAALTLAATALVLVGARMARRTRK